MYNFAAHAGGQRVGGAIVLDNLWEAWDPALAVQVVLCWWRETGVKGMREIPEILEFLLLRHILWL